VRGMLRDALVFTSLYTLAVWAVLFVLRGEIVALFGAEGDASSLVRFFCEWIAGSFLFAGGLLVANAAFNNLGFATYSTLFNWGRATLGTIPFVWLGSRMHGPEGALIGWATGGIAFGIAAVTVAFRVTKRFVRGAADELTLSRPALSPLSSGRSQLG
jgi:Na+-driven multidrug efflux pump